MTVARTLAGGPITRTRTARQGASEARLFAPEGVKVVIGDWEKRSVFASHNSTRE